MKRIYFLMLVGLIAGGSVFAELKKANKLSKPVKTAKPAAMAAGLPAAMAPKPVKTAKPIAKPVEAPKPEKFTADKEIIFKKSIAVLSRTIAIDGGAPEKVPCEHNTGNYSIFGTIAVDRDTKLRLGCKDDYLGGIAVIYSPGEGQEDIYKGIAMQDGDAGDQWDSRSWISLDPVTKQLTIENIVLASTEDSTTGKIEKCVAKKRIYRWNAAEREFSEEEEDDFPLGDFAPPLHVSGGCLDGYGKWKP